MRTIQQNLISMVKERTARKHLAVVVCMIAIATAFAVFWSLRISGITLANAEPSCGLEEHTHTDACYDWVATETDGTEAIEETEVTEMGEETEVTETGNGTDEAAAETTGASGSADSEEESEKAAEESTEASVSASGEDASADEDTLAEEDASADEETAKEDAASDETDEDTASVTGTESGETAAAYTEEGTESVTEAIAEDGTEEATEELTEQETESLQPGDTKVVDGVTYVYELICEMEEHAHTDECYESNENDSTAEEADADEVDAAGLTAGVANIASYGVSAASLDDDEDAIATVSDDESDTTDTTVTASNDDASDYYIATTVNGIPSDGSYIIYTYDETNGVYYVVNTDGTLSNCTEIASVSEVGEAGPYYVTSTGTILYGTSNSGTTAYNNALWSVAQDDSDSSAYTIVNPAESTSYLTPTGTSDDVTIGTGFTNRTGSVTLSGDFTLTYTFKNTGNVEVASDAEYLEANWYNYIVEIYNNNYSNNGVYIDFRADNYGWLNKYASSDANITWDTVSDLEWSSWLAAMNSGAVCTVTVSRSNNTFTITCSAAEQTFKAAATMTSSDFSTTATVYLTGEYCTISNVIYSYTDESADGGGSNLSSSVSSLVSSESGYVTFGSSSGGVTISRGDICAVVTDATSESNTTAAWKAYGTASTFYFAEAQKTADNYHFAETVTLADAAEKQDDSYVVYTQIGNTYYIVSAVDGSLLECTDISSDSYSEDDKVLLSSAAGVYIWDYDETTGEPEFKFTTGTDDEGTDKFENYRWCVSSSDYEATSGSGTYTLSNEQNEDYLAPELDLLTDDYSSTLDQYSTPVALTYGTVEFSLTEVSSRYHSSGNTAYNIQLWITNGDNKSLYYRVTYSVGAESVAYSVRSANNISYMNVYALGSMTITDGDIITITLIRDSNSIYVNYYNETQKETYMLVFEGISGIDEDESVYVYLYNDEGYYTVTTEVMDCNSDYGEGETISNSDDTVETTLTTINATKKSLSEEFDITYSFTNTSVGDGIDGATIDDNFAVQLNNGSDYIYVSFASQKVTNSSGDELSYTFVTTDNYSSDTTDLEMALAAGAECEVRVIRTGDNFFFALSATYSGTTYRMYVSVLVTDFGENVDIYLMGQYCTLSSITFTDNTARDRILTYKRVSDSLKSILVTTANEEGSTVSADSCLWTATGTGSYSEPFYLIAQFVTDTAGTAEIDWVSDASASAEASGTATTTLSNESVTSLSDTVVTTFSLARVTEYVVWFDETNGGMTLYNKNLTDTAVTTTSDATGSTYTVTALTEENSVDTGYFKLSLRGWYDIYNKKYYEPGESFTVNANTVLYADWISDTYDYGSSDDEGLANTVSTNSFITTTLYDFNELFNMFSADMLEVGDYVHIYNSDYSENIYQVLNASTHTEVFTNANTSSSLLTSAFSSSALNFMFFRTENYYFTSNSTTHNPIIDDAYSRSTNNSSKNVVTQEILGSLNTTTDGSNNTSDTTTNSLISILFGTNNTVDDYADDKNNSSIIYGKTVVGTGDNLFQYDEDTGYYSYDSSQNGASYNQTDERFYVYEEEDTIGSTTYFLPFNNGDDLSTTNNPNYWFGMSTEIEFYLADDVPDGKDTDGYGTANPSIDSDPDSNTYYHTTFKFSGDDDVWVFIDGVLVLDLGGVHGKVYGEIDFSTGEVTIVNCLKDQTTAYQEKYNDITEITTRGVLDYIEGVETVSQDATFVQSLEAGTHTLTFYYLERGAGESNAAIYFNISSSTYNLDLTKVSEGDNTTELEGAEFTFYTNSSFEEKADGLENEDGDEKSTFGSTEKVCGLREGVTYYVLETASPDGYTAAGKYFTVILKGNVLTITVYDSSDTAQELYIYTITYDSSTGETTVECTVTEDTDAEKGESVTNSSGWKYVLADADNLSVSAVITSGAVSYYNIGFKIANTKEYELPDTGSMGIFPYRCAGTVLVLVSITGLLITAFYHLVWVRKLRMRVKNKGYTEEKAKRGNHFARTRNHPRERSEIHGRDAPAALAHGIQERSRGTGPGTE